MVILIRHGKAKSKEEDPERSLTDEGVEETRKVAEFLRGKVKVVRIYHSDKKRAKQTAEIISKFLGGELTELEGIAPLDPPDTAYEICENSKDNIIIVGHLPHLSVLVGKLTGAECVKFICSGAVALEKVEGVWKVKWFISPELL